MKTRMFSMLMVLSSLMVMLSIVDCYAVLTPPTITASVEIEGDRKHYQYTLTNTALDHDGAPVVIGGFILWLTEAGWLAIESHDSPAGWKYNLRIGTGFATASWFTDN